jgi:hypothetical protein
LLGTAGSWKDNFHVASLAVQLPTSGISPMISSILAAKIDLLFPAALPRKRHASQEVAISALYLRAYMAL